MVVSEHVANACSSTDDEQWSRQAPDAFRPDVDLRSGWVVAHSTLNFWVRLVALTGTESGGRLVDTRLPVVSIITSPPFVAGASKLIGLSDMKETLGSGAFAMIYTPSARTDNLCCLPGLVLQANLG